MNILIPMAGAGQRFADAGYSIIKPAILTIDWRTGGKLPMVVCAIRDLEFAEADGWDLTCVIRDTPERRFLEDTIRVSYPNADFIYVDKLTEGQACTCLLGRNIINNDEGLLIGTCDNGMLYNRERLLSEMNTCDAIAFTYRNDTAVCENPNAYGWLRIDGNNFVTETSIKKSISDNPMNDHAITGAFWFKRGRDFVTAAEKMIAANDRINGEFYVDLTLKYLMDAGLRVKAFEINRYLGWGTPEDYERYQNTYEYWRNFAKDENLL
jgi:bifunctional N-acetylglucosamine-1-phosphate-uridyltransferase/glucosamine-1-phosphate-acetyltransferase GlmU-like protein